MIKGQTNGQSNYELFDDRGYLRERGGLSADGRRQGGVTFYRRGLPVYRRDYQNGVPSKTTSVFEISNETFEKYDQRRLSSGKTSKRFKAR